MENRYVAVIILQYGNYKATIDCIESVQRYNSYPVKYIVVDNASPDEGLSADKVVEYLGGPYGDTVLELVDGQQPETPLPHATVVRSKVNDGYARGNNKGLALAYLDDDIDKVMILNNDILFVEDIIPKLSLDLLNLKDSALVTPLLYKKGLTELDPNCARNEGRIRDTLLYNILLFKITNRMKRAIFIPVKPGCGTKAVPLISGSCIMCRKDIFKKIGGFDPNTFLYCEENILWEKVKQLNLLNYIDTDIKAIHLGASTIGRHFSFEIVKQSFKSQNYFVKTYLPYGKFKVVALKMTNIWVLSVFSAKSLLKRLFFS